MGAQDITAERSRLMRDGKRGPTVVSETEQLENIYFTYNGDGNIETIIKERLMPNGAIWRKTQTFSYEPGSSRISQKLETLELI